jgi:superfamily II DNA or RNA helicase
MIRIRKKNEAHIVIESDDSGILRELSEYFTFYVEGYKFMPAYKSKMWDGKVRLFDMRSQQLPFGLLGKVAEFAGSRKYELDVDSEIRPTLSATDTELDDFIKELPLCSGGNEIQAREYQVDAFKKAAQSQRAILLSPTGSGKSLIIYMLSRYFLSKDMDRKILIVVPTTSLVEQMTKDFADYSLNDTDFNVDDEVHKIYSGKEKFNIDASIVITTWQSAIKLPLDWFVAYGMVIGDEAHTFKAKSLTTIMNRLNKAYFRIGTTGTLDGGKVNELVLEGSFGPTYKVTSTKKLIDSDTLADLKIEALVMKYPDDVKKLMAKAKYQDEIDFIVSYANRNNFIANLALDQSGNTLVLYNLVIKHGKPLYDLIKKRAKDRNVFFVSGEVNAEERERIRELTEKETGAIIVASSGTFSTGINIKNLHNIIFAAPTKSQIRVLQSIGRGLRKSDSGQPTVVYDLADDLCWKKHKNYTHNHAINRIKIYAKEGFEYNIHEVPMK